MAKDIWSARNQCLSASLELDRLLELIRQSIPQLQKHGLEGRSIRTESGLQMAEGLPPGDAVQGGLVEQVQLERPVVLVVDDEASVRRTLSLMLQHSGYSVIAAASGAEALARLATGDHRVRAIVTDQNMPGMRGTELVTHLIEQGIDLPVLFVSGQPQVALAGDQASAPRRFLAKPFTQAKLLAELSLLLQSSRRVADP